MRDLITLMDTQPMMLAEKMAKPLAELLLSQGYNTSEAEVRQLILDGNLTIQFPDFAVEKDADVVTVGPTEVTTQEAVVTEGNIDSSFGKLDTSARK